MNPSEASDRESNVTRISGSPLTGSSVVTGSGARAVVINTSAGAEEVELAISQLQQALEEARAATDQRDDETRGSIVLALDKLAALTAELRSASPKRDWGRVKRLLGGISDAVTRLTSLTGNVDALREAVERLVR